MARVGARVLVAVAAGLLVLPAAGALGRNSVATSPPVVPNELIVGFKSSVPAAQQAAAVQQAGASQRQRFDQIDAVLIRVSGAQDQVAKALLNDPRVRYVEPNHIVSIAATPNDTRYNELWGMNNTGQTGGTPDADIDAPEAWNVETGSSSVAVGVIDTGVDFSHPDLPRSSGSTPARTAAPLTRPLSAQTGQRRRRRRQRLRRRLARLGLRQQRQQPVRRPQPRDARAGTIGAVGNNGVGVVGVNWNVKIAALKFLNASGNGSTADAIGATLYAADEGIKITNNSWGGGGFDQALLDAIEYGATQGHALRRGGRELRANNDASPFYPPRTASDVIAAVAATDHNDASSSFSNYGLTTVDLGAPGTSILSTVPGGGYSLFNGTSMATPHVAGAAALLKAHFPTATAYGLKALLMRTVDPKPSMNGITVTGGRLNLNQRRVVRECAQG